MANKFVNTWIYYLELVRNEGYYIALLKRNNLVLSVRLGSWDRVQGIWNLMVWSIIDGGPSSLVILAPWDDW